MAGSRRLRSVRARVVLGRVGTWAALPRPADAAGTAPAAETGTAPALRAWNGGVDLYRDGSFTTQRSWLWCTAAGVQIVRNIVDREEDHSTRGQRAYFEWMRDRNRYDLPASAGVDPQGWTAGLRHFVDDRYRLVSSRTFDEALRSAVKRMRLTNLPVAITVSHGGHGWILTGFRATADPATTASFKVTSVRVVGPLFGRQSKNGYDMPPNTKLTPTQLKRFFTPWKYDPKPMIWDGRYVSIQPVPKTVPKAAAAAAPSPTPPPASATAGPTATTIPTPAMSPTPAASASPISLAAVLASSTPRSTSLGDVSATVPARHETIPGVVVVVVVCLSALAILGAAAVRSRMRRRTPVE